MAACVAVGISDALDGTLELRFEQRLRAASLVLLLHGIELREGAMENPVRLHRDAVPLELAQVVPTADGLFRRDPEVEPVGPADVCRRHEDYSRALEIH